VSLLLAGLVFAGTSGALYLGRWIARRRNAGTADGTPPPTEDTRTDEEKVRDEEEAKARAEVEKEVPTNKDVEDDDDNNQDTEKKKDNGGKKSAAKTIEDAINRAKKKATKPAGGDTQHLGGFICQLGDVLMRITGEEAWLAGGVVLSEEVPIAVLFVAPDAGHDCVIYVRCRPRASLFWLEPLDPKAILVGGEPPSSVEHNGIRFDRSRRLPLRPKRIGVGAPDVGDAVVVAEYNSAGAERLLVLKANSGMVRAYRGLELEEGSFEVIASGDSTLE
jgi:hypothetical protein